MDQLLDRDGNSKRRSKLRSFVFPGYPQGDFRIKAHVENLEIFFIPHANTRSWENFFSCEPQPPISSFVYRLINYDFWFSWSSSSSKVQRLEAWACAWQADVDFFAIFFLHHEAPRYSVRDRIWNWNGKKKIPPSPQPFGAKLQGSGKHENNPEINK